MRRNGIIFMSKEVANLTPCKVYKTKMETQKVVVKHYEKYRRIMYQAFLCPFLSSRETKGSNWQNKHLYLYVTYLDLGSM